MKQTPAPHEVQTPAMYEVQIGMLCKDIDTDNMRKVTLVADTATDAINRVKLHRSEYVAQVILICRADA